MKIKSHHGKDLCKLLSDNGVSLHTSPNITDKLQSLPAKLPAEQSTKASVKVEAVVLTAGNSGTYGKQSTEVQPAKVQASAELAVKESISEPVRKDSRSDKSSTSTVEFENQKLRLISEGGHTLTEGSFLVDGSATVHVAGQAKIILLKGHVEAMQRCMHAAALL